MSTDSRSCTDCVLLPMCRPAVVPVDELEHLAGSVLPRAPLKTGQYLFRAGSPCRSVFISQSGTMKLVRVTEDGGEQLMGFYLPGELIGLEAMASKRFPYDAIAAEPALVCEVPIEALERVARQKTSLQSQLMRASGECIAREQTHIELLGKRLADERIALFLIALVERSGKWVEDQHWFTLPLSRGEIGSYLHLTIETVSRAFTHLRDKALIQTDGRKIRLLDVAALRRLAGTSLTSDRYGMTR